jgi:hypothetical protein
VFVLSKLLSAPAGWYWFWREQVNALSAHVVIDQRV